MRINENRLKQIIREEARRVLNEQATQDGGWEIVDVKFDLDSLMFDTGVSTRDTSGSITAVVKLRGTAHGDLSGHVEGKVRMPCTWCYTDYSSYDSPDLYLHVPKSYEMEESDYDLTLDGKPLSDIEDGLSHLYFTDFARWFESTLHGEVEQAFDDDKYRILDIILDELKSGSEKYPDFD